MKKILFFIIVLIFYFNVFSVQAYLIHMDNLQNNHLKAYGVVYRLIDRGVRVHWLLNYRGGSFLLEGPSEIKKHIEDKGVSYEKVDSEKLSAIETYLSQQNSDKVLIDRITEIAVYTPDTTNPWDDAVTLALEYAEIPYDKIYDEDILEGVLPQYDWLHLHHEDFSGQFGKFYGAYGRADWYQEKQKVEETRAQKLGYSTVPELKGAVALKIREYVEEGGFLFAMCAATETLDIALSALETDIVAPEISGTPIDNDYEEKMDFSLTFAFEDFNLVTNPYIYEFSDIDIEVTNIYENIDSIKLFEFAAKFDRTAAILTQNHERVIKDFLGQTTSFRRKYVKDDVLVLGYIDDDVVKYIHGVRGEGTFTFLGGHDPEDYAHLVGQEPTDLSFHPNSAGYRLILNNVLFPSAEKKKLKT
ncbi:MAG: asparagine synthetase B [Candidatus Muiribacteriota bacterium]